MPDLESATRFLSCIEQFYISIFLFVCKKESAVYLSFYRVESSVLEIFIFKNYFVVFHVNANVKQN